MVYEWSTQKRLENLQKHGVDFSDAENMELENAIIFTDNRQEYKELRYVAYGHIHDRLHCLVFTIRGHKVRITSLRKANRREVKRHG